MFVTFMNLNDWMYEIRMWQSYKTIVDKTEVIYWRNIEAIYNSTLRFTNHWVLLRIFVSKKWKCQSLFLKESIIKSISHKTGRDKEWVKSDMLKGMTLALQHLFAEKSFSRQLRTGDYSAKNLVVKHTNIECRVDAL